MEQEKSVIRNLADAEALDYEEIHPKESIYNRSTFKHIIGGICLGLLVVGIITTIIVSTANN